MGLESTISRLKGLLESGEIRQFLGYQAGSTPFAARPLIATVPEELERALFSPLCVGNLVRLLVEERRRVLGRGEQADRRPTALVVKGCDSRAVNVLIQEHILDRQSLVLVGMPCVGVVDPRRARGFWEARRRSGDRSRVVVNAGGLFESGENAAPTRLATLDEIMADPCRICLHRNPVVADELIWDEVEERASSSGHRYAELDRLMARDAATRWRLFSAALSDCIRCNACKNVCPLCYCEECTIAKDREQTVLAQDKSRKTAWIDVEVCPSNNIAFHLNRALHLAGRCVDCGECERACPADIPLRLLYNAAERVVMGTFGYEAGLSSEVKPVLATFDPSDRDEFIEG